MHEARVPHKLKDFFYPRWSAAASLKHKTVFVFTCSTFTTYFFSRFVIWFCTQIMLCFLFIWNYLVCKFFSLIMMIIVASYILLLSNFFSLSHLSFQFFLQRTCSSETTMLGWKELPRANTTYNYYVAHILLFFCAAHG